MLLTFRPVIIIIILTIRHFMVMWLCGNEVSIKTRSTPPLLPFKGQVTEQTSVKINYLLKGWSQKPRKCILNFFWPNFSFAQN